MTKEQFSNFINNFEFSELFIKNGWDNFTYDNKIEIQNNIYTLTGVVQKKGFAILQITTQSKIPDLNTRKQFEKKIRKLYHDHLLIFINKEKTQAFWQLPLYEDGKFKKLITFSWHKGQDVEGLFQKLRNIVFKLEEEDYLALSDVKERVNTLSANSEKVIKTFYAEFSKQHKTFLGFIKGIEDAIPDTENNKKQWYASLMLNRLMFCYFIQKKGFLDGNIHYLREKLHECKKYLGKNNFYGFYCSFLLELFHNELGRPEDKRKKNISPVPFGVIPYLNGGLFDIHELESTYAKIAIKDEAFERVFAFFDEWNWHLDTRITASGKDINPDVIGYIFEKYINQKEMGAYYTKEDITDYIGKNTIIPFLLDKVKSWYPAPFENGGGFWQYLQDSGDEYIYDSVKKGGEGLASLDKVNIPENIRIGIDTQKPNLLERRKDWNTATPDDIGLPTEIWRETISRLQRYFELREKISKGKIQEINDLITYNLNIRKLIQDYLEQTQDKKFIRAFYKALTEITILDPTCGSGAFLFAALNILEPLYEVCIQRMEEWFKANPKGNTDFEDKLTTLHSSEHPNLSYYIFKTIILNNLYGVDLMKEAVEIAKLRLFLKLVAEVDPSRRKKNYGLEPLPDIDFNIRSGNTLVGFATEQQLEEVVKSTEGDLIYKEKLDGLKSKCKTVEKSFSHFQKIQTETSSNSDAHKESKKTLINDLKELDEDLNRYLADTYGLGAKTQWKSKKEKEAAYQAWKENHQPFHWFAEFYGIISKGGFDVVIGNPPYVEYSKVNKDYAVKGYETESCGNLYAFVIERSINLIRNISYMGMIVPVSLGSTPRMERLRQIIEEVERPIFYSSYADRPTGLFNGVHQILSIFLLGKSSCFKLLSSGFIHWYKDERETLFNDLTYIDSSEYIKDKIWGKYGNHKTLSIYTKVLRNKNNLIDYFIKCGKLVSISGGTGGYWLRAFDVKQQSNKYKEKYVIDDNIQKCICGYINSSLYYIIWRIYSNCRDFTDATVCKLYIDIEDELSLPLNLISLKHLKALKNTNEIREGVLTYEQYRPAKVKNEIDEIDKVLAKHYGFTEEELDFIINYDIKYRMGNELEGEE